MNSRARTLASTLLAMLAFAGNSLLCRLALAGSAIDAARFTGIRVASGALALWLIVRFRGASKQIGGNWISAFALFAYAALFSWAYLSLTAGTGALLLFGAVQATMIGYGAWTGERLGLRRAAGVVCALAGLVGLVLPGIAAPPAFASLLMLGAGVAWGVYSLRGKGALDATATTAGNFLRAVPMAVVMVVFAWPTSTPDGEAVACAIASGALTSGVGYAIWYAALRELKPASAAVVQLSVPVLAALGGIAFLGEVPSLRLLAASAAILGGIALVVVQGRPAPDASPRHGGAG